LAGELADRLALELRLMRWANKIERRNSQALARNVLYIAAAGALVLVITLTLFASSAAKNALASSMVLAVGFGLLLAIYALSKLPG
jgi:hypothetical protein